VRFLGDEALHQPLGVWKILLASSGTAIRLRLREMQRARHRSRAHARPALRSPVLLQGLPHRPPVLRGRLHDDFFDVVLDQPRGQSAQGGRRRADLLAFEVKIAVDFDVGHHDRQHLLVDVNARDPVRHRALLWKSGERASSHQSGSRAIAGPRSRPTRRSIVHSITHAPDHTVARPQQLHWLVRSDRSRPYCGSRRFSSSFTGRTPTSTVAKIVPDTPPISCFVPADEQVEWLTVSRTESSAIEGAVR
jgi:hypothetical protein